MRTRHFGHTDAGRKRKRNEDAWLGDERLGLFVVCDGVGGRARGDLASEETVELIWDWVKGQHHVIQAALADAPTQRSEDNIARLGALVRSAVQNACYMVHGMGQVDPEHRGMSTTATVVLVAGDLMIVGQVGDSRVYLARGGAVSQLTEDHTWHNLQIKEGMLSPEQAKRQKTGKHMITRAVGLKEFVDVDVLAVPVNVGDRLLLCSDGLHGYLDDADSLMTDLFDQDIRNAAPAAIRHANACGGEDNITALFVEFLATP